MDILLMHNFLGVASNIEETKLTNRMRVFKNESHSKKCYARALKKHTVWLTWKQQSNTGAGWLYFIRRWLAMTSYKRTDVSQDDVNKNWLELGPNLTDVIPSVGGFFNWNSLGVSAMLICIFHFNCKVK